MSQNNVNLVVCTLCVLNRDWIFLGECFMSNHSIQSTCGLLGVPAGYREIFFGKYSMSSEPCFLAVGISAGWLAGSWSKFLK